MPTSSCAADAIVKDIEYQFEQERQRLLRCLTELRQSADERIARWAAFQERQLDLFRDSPGLDHDRE